MAMTMKEQERKVLGQIMVLVGELGEDSYIGTAFEGCWQIAHDNIENDWACSMKQMAENAEKKLAAAKQDVNELAEQLKEKDMEIIKLKAKLYDLIDK